MTPTLSSRISNLLDQRFERNLACLIGLAVGDALGATNEFKPRGSFAPIDDMVGGGPFGLEPGQWTDDTSMALCLAESFIKRRRFDLADQMDRYCQWYRHGHLSSTGECFDIGRATMQALERFMATRQPKYEAPSQPYCGDAHTTRGAGNGSLMRLAPVPMAWNFKPRLAVALAGHQSLTTHPDLRCVDACRYFCALLLCAIEGLPKEQILDWTQMPHRKLFAGAEALCPEVAAVAEGSFRDKSIDDIRPTGYVVDSLETALWAFACTDSFAEGALLVANLGGDSDTNAAIYGMIAGAHYGFGRAEAEQEGDTDPGIPLRWVDRLAKPQWLIELGTQVIGSGGRRPPALIRTQAVVVEAVGEDGELGRGWLFHLGADNPHDYELRLDPRPTMLPEQLTISDESMPGNPARRRIAGRIKAWLDASRCVVELAEDFVVPPKQAATGDLMGCVVTVVSRDGRSLRDLVVHCRDERSPDEAGPDDLDCTRIEAYFWQCTAGRSGKARQQHFRLVKYSERADRLVEQEFEFSFGAEDVHVAFRAPRRSGR